MRGALLVVGTLFAVAGAMYLLAAMGVEALDNLTVSAGGPWVQGLGALAIWVGMIVYANRMPKS